MFAETLKKVVDNVDGGIAAVIMGLDGIPVETYVRQNDDRVDINTVAMEFSFILGQVRKAGDSLQVGSLEELSVKAQRLAAGLPHDLAAVLRRDRDRAPTATSARRASSRAWRRRRSSRSSRLAR